MKISLLLLFAALLLPAADTNRQAEQEVRAALEAYKQALIQRDAAALARVLGDDLIYTHSSNKHEDKAAVLASLKGDNHVEAIEFKDLKIRIYGNTAVVVGDADFHDANAAGVRTLNRLNVLHIFVKGPRGWQMVARQAVKYPDAPSAQ